MFLFILAPDTFTKKDECFVVCCTEIEDHVPSIDLQNGLYYTYSREHYIPA